MCNHTWTTWTSKGIKTRVIVSTLLFLGDFIIIYYFQNAAPSSRESMKIDGQQVDCYIGSIIEAATSSLGDIVVRVSSSTEQSEKDFGNSSASSLNVWESWHHPIMKWLQVRVLLQSVSLREELQFQLRNMRHLMPPVKKVITAVSWVCSIASSSAKDCR